MVRDDVPIAIAPGELPTLESLLDDYYHQDAWVIASTNEEIWGIFAAHEARYSLAQLAREIELLLAQGSEAIHSFVQEHAEALYSLDAEGSREWAENLRSWLAGRHVV